jgi:hypothetical protein
MEEIHITVGDLNQATLWSDMALVFVFSAIILIGVVRVMNRKKSDPT